MSWYDWVTLILIGAVTVIQTVRGIRAGGFGLTMFEAAGVVVAAAAATYFAHGLAGQLHARESVTMLALFIAFSLYGLSLGFSAHPLHLFLMLIRYIKYRQRQYLLGVDKQLQ